MGPKKSNKNKEAKNERRWTKKELNTYADVHADPDSCFAATLDKLALKKSSNNEVFECIQKELVSEMEAEDFQTRNSEHFKGRPTKLNTSIEKLRTKYKWFKLEWSNKTNRAKSGSGLDPDKEPHWYQILNPVFAETHKPLNLVSSAANTSFVNDNYLSDYSEEDDYDDNERVELSKETELNDIDREIMETTDDGEEKQDDDPPGEDHQEKPPRKKSKVVVPAHKKSEKI